MPCIRSNSHLWSAFHFWDSSSFTIAAGAERGREPAAFWQAPVLRRGLEARAAVCFFDTFQAFVTAADEGSGLAPRAGADRERLQRR